MRQVILSKKASEKLELLLNYLEKEWSLKVKKSFIRKLDKSLKIVQKYPESCRESNSIKGLHMLVITKQTSVFYRFDAQTIQVVTIFDTRMNPSNIEKETK